MSKQNKSEPGSPAIKKIVVKKNDTFSHQIVGYNNDGTPYDFTGHVFIMQVKENAIDTISIVDITNSGFTITANADGITAGVNNVVDILHANTNFDIEAKEYVYDIQMTDAVSSVQTIQEGIFEVTQDVSR